MTNLKNQTIRLAGTLALTTVALGLAAPAALACDKGHSEHQKEAHKDHDHKSDRDESKAKHDHDQAKAEKSDKDHEREDHKDKVANRDEDHKPVRKAHVEAAVTATPTPVAPVAPATVQPANPLPATGGSDLEIVIAGLGSVVVTAGTLLRSKLR